MTTPESEPSVLYLDLDAAFADLPIHKQTPDLINGLRLYRETLSAQADLQFAQVRLDAALVFLSNQGSVAQSRIVNETEQAIIGALIDSCVIIYGRIVTKNDDRGRVSVQKGWTGQLRESHDRLVGLRHAGVGHFSRGQESDGRPLATDRIYLQFNDTSSGLVPTWTRANYKAWVVHDLQLVFPAAHAAFPAIIERRSKDLWDAMDKLSDDDWLTFQPHVRLSTNVGSRAMELGLGQHGPQSFHNIMPRASLDEPEWP